MAKANKESGDGERRRSKGRGGDSGADGNEPQDAMSQCVALCQEQRWREAALLLRRLTEKADRGGKSDLSSTFAAALQKIEYSLRRQMAVATIVAARDLLAKEYLLDVGQ